MTAPVYRDGVGGLRCDVCHALLRDGAGKPVVSVRVDDLEDILQHLVEDDDPPALWGPLIRRLEQAIGQTAAQVAQRTKGPA